MPNEVKLSIENESYALNNDEVERLVQIAEQERAQAAQLQQQQQEEYK